MTAERPKCPHCASQDGVYVYRDEYVSGDSGQVVALVACKACKKILGTNLLDEYGDVLYKLYEKHCEK